MDSSDSEPSPTSHLSAEIRDLRNKIISVKKTVTKGDKKQKKAVQDEIAALEIFLTMKQKELQKLKNSVVVAAPTETCNSFDEEKIINKARMKKERRKEEKAAEWEANRQAALAEIASRPDLALEESKAFAHQLTQEGFRILEVAADGHCMFSAVGCQLEPARDHWELRKVAAEYLLNHRSEYEHFIDYDDEEKAENGSADSDDKFINYCHKLESTGMWGGQIELQVLSRALDIGIVVLQAQAPKLEFNVEEGDKQRIYLSYHRHAFSLGEHYNALLKVEPL